MTVLGEADGDYPLQKKRHSLEFLRSIAHLRPRTNTFGAVFRMRSALAFAVHRFFQERGFLYVQTPIITASDCEGAGELFRVTTLDAKSPPLKMARVDLSGDFFGEKAGLTVSGQLEGELFATAFADIYTFGPTFRAENSNTSRHAAEFWMIEPEMAFADLAADCALAEDFLRYLVRYALEHCGEDLAFFDQRIEKGLIARLETLAAAEFRHHDLHRGGRGPGGLRPQFRVSRRLGARPAVRARTLPDRGASSAARSSSPTTRSDQGLLHAPQRRRQTVAAMDLLVPRVGEIIGGSQREERLDVLDARMAAVGIDPESLWWYLDIRRWGSCPTPVSASASSAC